MTFALFGRKLTRFAVNQINCFIRKKIKRFPTRFIDRHEAAIIASLAVIKVATNDYQFINHTCCHHRHTCLAKLKWIPTLVLIKFGKLIYTSDFPFITFSAWFNAKLSRSCQLFKLQFFFCLDFHATDALLDLYLVLEFVLEKFRNQSCFFFAAVM